MSEIVQYTSASPPDFGKPGDWYMEKTAGGIVVYERDDNGNWVRVTPNRSGGIVFSDVNVRPAGDWQLWFQDFGEIDNFTLEETPLILETAPLDAPGKFVFMYDDGEGETILNMTDDPGTAGDDDIIIVED